MQIIRRGFGVVRRLLHIQQIAINIMLQNEASRIEPIPHISTFLSS